MKALFVYRFLTLGGVETVLRTRADLLPDRGIEPRFWFFENVDGLRLFRNRYERVAIGGPDQLEEHLSSHNYDVISTVDTPELFRLQLPPSSKCSLVLESHSPYKENLGYLSKISAPISLVIVPSMWQLAEVRRRMKAEIAIRVIPNPLGVNFAAPIKPFPFPPDRPILAWLGRLDALKNWKGFLEIAGKLADSGCDFNLWLAARAPTASTTADLLRIARQYGVLDRLKWFRNLSHEAVPRFLDAVRESGGLVLSTARGESFGMTLAEAMARQCAVVAPDFGPFPEFIDDNRGGILVPPGDLGCAVAACQRLMGDDGLRQSIGRHARQAILAEHEPASAVAKLSDALLQCANCR